MIKEESNHAENSGPTSRDGRVSADCEVIKNRSKVGAHWKKCAILIGILFMSLRVAKAIHRRVR
jgi:hypothetical protein